VAPYRTPEPQSKPSARRIDLDFWNEPNSYLELRALQAVDTAIVSGLTKLVLAWYRETQIKYPKDYHPILQDLGQAALGKGVFLRVSGESKHLISVLIEVARMEELMIVRTKLFDEATADGPTMTAWEKESAVRWVSNESAIRSLMNSAFASGVNRLDKVLLSRFRPEDSLDVMKTIYFRGVVQGDTASYDSFRLAQNLYQAFYE